VLRAGTAPLPAAEPAACAESGLEPEPGLQRIALCLQYDGRAFHGWQRQSRLASVQQTLEDAIAALDPHRPVHAVAAGRTDTGVHAAGQVVHVDAAGPIPPQRWARALNGRLPASVRVKAAAAVPPDWHACYAARFRLYRYGGDGCGVVADGA
jgi:tRNA pseudouridine38-40 synthase